MPSELLELPLLPLSVLSPSHSKSSTVKAFERHGHQRRFNWQLKTTFLDRMDKTVVLFPCLVLSLHDTFFVLIKIKFFGKEGN